jgi:single-stranded DNA-binding protein
VPPGGVGPKNNSTQKETTVSHIIIEGNLTADAEGGYGKESGKQWARLNVAVNNRVKSQDGSWTDGPTSFYRVTAFGSLAENAMNSSTRATP